MFDMMKFDLMKFYNVLTCDYWKCMIDVTHVGYEGCQGYWWLTDRIFACISYWMIITCYNYCFTLSDKKIGVIFIWVQFTTMVLHNVVIVVIYSKKNASKISESWYNGSEVRNVLCLCNTRWNSESFSMWLNASIFLIFIFICTLILDI